MSASRDIPTGRIVATQECLISEGLPTSFLGVLNPDIVRTVHTVGDQNPLNSELSEPVGETCPGCGHAGEISVAHFIGTAVFISVGVAFDAGKSGSLRRVVKNRANSDRDMGVRRLVPSAPKVLAEHAFDRR